MANSDIPSGLLVLVEAFSRSSLREMHVRNGDFELYLSNDASVSGPLVCAAPQSAAVAPAVAAPVAPVPSPVVSASATPAAPAVPADAIIVRAPNLGTFYRAPKPGAPAYVEVGSTVAAGDELCLIEVMKLFTSVCAEAPGRIHAVLVEDGAMVEAGQPLFAVVKV